MIWDIIGHQGFRQLLQQAYFFGTHGLIAVCDTTRENTLSELRGWMDAVLSITNAIPTIFLGNKYDLEEYREVGSSELNNFASGYENTQVLFSSAKTGHNVDQAFKTLGERIIKDSQ